MHFCVQWCSGSATRRGATLRVARAVLTSEGAGRGGVSIGVKARGGGPCEGRGPVERGSGAQPRSGQVYDKAPPIGLRRETRDEASQSSAASSAKIADFSLQSSVFSLRPSATQRSAPHRTAPGRVGRPQ